MKELPYKDEVQQVFVSFNKLTGAHFGQRVGGSIQTLPQEYLTWRALNFNPNTHRWVGDLEDGSVMAKSELKVKTDEVMLDDLCRQKIEKEVKLHNQLNTYSKIFKVLIEKGVLSEEDDGVQEFLDQQEVIDRARKNNELYKKARAASPDESYKTKEQLDAKKNSQLAGGLNVILGRGKL